MSSSYPAAAGELLHRGARQALHGLLVRAVTGRGVRAGRLRGHPGEIEGVLDGRASGPLDEAVAVEQHDVIDREPVLGQDEGQSGAQRPGTGDREVRRLARGRRSPAAAGGRR